MPGQVDPDTAQQFKLLLVADSAADAETVQLAMVDSAEWRVEKSVPRSAVSGQLSSVHGFSVVLLDLGLPDSARRSAGHAAAADGWETLAHVRAAAPEVPIVVLGGPDEDGQALTAIQQGAQDYLPKDRLDGHLLRRALRHAIERKRAEVQVIQHARQIEAAHARIQQQAAQLQARAEQLDRINRELDDFAYIASHDLQEPLRGIRAYCEILLEDYHDRLDAVGQRRLATLVELCDRLEHLIRDLLTYCRAGWAPAGGRSRPADPGVDLGAVVNHVLDTLRPAIDRRGASVRVVGRLPKVSGDATLIGMALANLICNGLKFNDRPEPQVEIGCLPTEPPTFYVRDDGIGIEPKHHEAIFTIFRRLHSRKKYKGTGAGLTIVRKIVQAHGGRIWVESEPGVGSTFFFTLAPCEGEPAGKPPGDGRVSHPQIPLTAPPPHWGEHPRAAGQRQQEVSLGAGS